MRARSGPAKSSLTIRDIAPGRHLRRHRFGLRVPRDVSIVGFDDRPQSAFTTPALTAVRQPEIEMGAAAVAALLRELRGDAVGQCG